jgi:amidase
MRSLLTTFIQDIYAALNLSGEPAIPNIKDLVNPDLEKLDVNQVWQSQLDKWNYQMEYLAAIHDFEAKIGREMDAIVAPITPTAAIRHNQFKYYGYATAINVLDFTSVVVPVTFADKDIDVETKDFVPLTDMDAAVHGECEFPLLLSKTGRKRRKAHVYR